MSATPSILMVCSMGFGFLSHSSNALIFRPRPSSSTAGSPGSPAKTAGVSRQLKRSRPNWEMTARQVQRLIGQLCSARFLRKDSQYRPNGSQTANAYVFLYHASLAPSPVFQQENAYPTHLENGRMRSQGDKNVVRGVTPAPPLEESPLNSNSVNSSSSSMASTSSAQAAAGPEPEQYPLSAARFRQFFPTITSAVIGRILRATPAACPDSGDEDIAAAVYTTRDQNSPGLWVHTMPDRVQEIIQRRISTRTPVPKCQLCRDAGILWDKYDKADWCSAGCEASEMKRQENPNFVAEWNAEFSTPRRKRSCATTSSEAADGVNEVRSRANTSLASTIRSQSAGIRRKPAALKYHNGRSIPVEHFFEAMERLGFCRWPTGRSVGRAKRSTRRLLHHPAVRNNSPPPEP